METRGTPLFRRRLSTVEAARICRLVAEGTGIRAIARATGRHRDFVGRLLTAFSKDSLAGTRYLFNVIKLGKIEIEAFWRTVAAIRKEQGKRQDEGRGAEDMLDGVV
ncbi:MAG: helix-turn-helix domain-containing protein [Thermoplasmata archaeon]